MPARNVSLTEHFAEFVERNVETGRFQNASEVVREGLRLLEQQQREDELKLEALRQAIAQAQAEVAEGRAIRIEHSEIGAYLSGLGRGDRR